MFRASVDITMQQQNETAVIKFPLK